MSNPKHDNVEQVLFEFASEPVHDRQTFERYLREHPSMVEELVDLSLELRLQRAAEGQTTPADEAWVDASWQAFQAILSVPKVEPVDPFALLTPRQLLTLRRELGVPSSVMVGFRARLVDLATVPDRFLEVLARGLQTTTEQLHSFLANPPRLVAGLSYKSNEAPVAVSSKISFEQLLEEAKVPEEQRRRLISGRN
ncbi:hypothetical protein IAI58_11595 [Roseomonas marmotae]|uniref:hypothetical protein n=1 Tax=Roseomonas marmotae TaxID=2768161 RepID=UPI001AD72939|nr:hypothetical protein [Roseomonas marmotae]QTI78335.1 hypothetical protein IAI58_11595 [Roseomonas marmotae]